MQPAKEEARDWVMVLRAFTVSDLAESMAVPLDVAVQYMRYFRDRGVIEPTEEMLNGTGPPERVYMLAPYPPGPRRHPHKTPPEVLVRQQMGGDPLRVQRGMPVRLVDNQDRRNKMQVAGGNRRRMKDRDRAYDRMMEAVAKRKEKQREKQEDKVQEKARRKRERLMRRQAAAAGAISKAREIRERVG